MYDILRIVLYLVSFIGVAYALNGVDFSKVMRPQSALKMQILYILLSMGIAYLVAQFLMGLSMNYFM